MRRLVALALLLVAAAADARVLSYAAYSDTPGVRGTHDRTTRHFLGVEGDRRDAAFVFRRGSIVLYDSTGSEEPRVVLTSGNSVHGAALYQRDPAQRPMLLVAGGDYRTRFSSDGGLSWSEVSEAANGSLVTAVERDGGGPSTYGLAAPVQTGSDRYPFVALYHRGGSRTAYAIGNDGRARTLGTADALLGRNHDGTRFLAREGKTLKVIGIDFAKTIAGNIDAVAGWITADGDVYAVLRIGTTRELRLYREFTHDVVATSDALTAIPTHDFDGAWLSVRDAAGTSLLRHGQRRRLETMWTDPAAPEVEALHAGASGQTLLIQLTHRRPGGLSRGGVSLAVWRLGDPAPPEYHDLLGRMDAIRGFAHLDVDAVANGAPFVFDTFYSSWVWVSAPSGTPRPAAAAGGADIVQEWGLLRASLRCTASRV